MMEDGLAAPERSGPGCERRALLRRQHVLDRVHLSGESRDRQQVPAMASGNVLQAPVLLGRVVQRYPAREVRHRLRAGPVRVVLVPRDDAAVLRRLAEELIVPETDRALEQLRRGGQERWRPQKIVERGRRAPGAERVEEDRRRVARFVRVVLVEELAPGMG